MRAEKAGVVVGFVMLMVVISLIYTYPLKDNDLWWQMEIGEYLLTNETLRPDHSIYSWTIADPNWRYNAWIGQILLYAAHKAGGIAGLHLLIYLSVLLPLCLFFVYIRISKGSITSVHFIAALVFVVGWHFSSDLKPETFSFIILNSLVFVYFYSLQAERDLFWLYPLMMLLWVNTHGAFIFGGVFLCLIFFGELINRLIRRSSLDDKRLRNLGICAVLSGLMLFVTPYGWDWLGSIYRSFTDANFMRQAMNLAAYKSIFMFAHPVKYMLLVAAMVFGLLALWDIKTRRNINIAVIAVNAVFIYLSLMYGRSVYLYFPVWLYTVAWYVKELNLIGLFQRRALIFAGVFIVACVYLTTYILTTPRHYKYLSLGVSEYFPNNVSDFLLSNRLEGRMFNTYEIGGYLMWRLYPRYKVFIDPRHGPYSRYLVDDYRVFELGGAFDAFTQKYPFDLAIVHITWNQLLKNFYFSPQWKLLYFDQSSALFVKKEYDTSRFKVDLGPQRFRGLKSYEGMFYTMNLYYIMEDYNSARYMLELLKGSYNYGMYKDSILSVEGLLRNKSSAILNE